jgi:transformation/transcription domain-associated protein
MESHLTKISKSFLHANNANNQRFKEAFDRDFIHSRPSFPQVMENLRRWRDRLQTTIDRVRAPGRRSKAAWTGACARVFALTNALMGGCASVCVCLCVRVQMPMTMNLENLSRYLVEFQRQRYEDLEIPGQSLLARDATGASAAAGVGGGGSTNINDLVRIDRFQPIVHTVRKVLLAPSPPACLTPYRAQEH